MTDSRAVLCITPELLLEVLKLPATTSFVDLRVNHFKGNCIEVLLEDKELFDATPEGTFYPNVVAIYESTEDDFNFSYYDKIMEMGRIY